MLRFLLLNERKDNKYRRAVRDRDITWNLVRLRRAVDAAVGESIAAREGGAGHAAGPLGLEILVEVLVRVEEIVK